MKLELDLTKPLTVVNAPTGTKALTDKTRTSPYYRDVTIRVLATDLVSPGGFTTALGVLMGGTFGMEEFLWTATPDGLIGEGTTTRPLFLKNVDG